MLQRAITAAVMSTLVLCGTNSWAAKTIELKVGDA